MKFWGSRCTWKREDGGWRVQRTQQLALHHNSVLSNISEAADHRAVSWLSRCPVPFVKERWQNDAEWIFIYVSMNIYIYHYNIYIYTLFINVFFLSFSLYIYIFIVIYSYVLYIYVHYLIEVVTFIEHIARIYVSIYTYIHVYISTRTYLDMLHMHTYIYSKRMDFLPIDLSCRLVDSPPQKAI